MEWRQRLVVAVACLVAAGCSPAPEPGAYGQELFSAVKAGDVEDVRSLLKAGADPNARDEWRDTPLHEATYVQNVSGSGIEAAMEIIRLLLKAGANPNATNEAGHAPGRMSSLERWPEIAEILDAAGRLPE